MNSPESPEGFEVNRSNMEYLDQSDKKISREEFIKFATDLSEMLDGQGHIKRVGLIGSVARGKENPTDLDMAIFIDEASFLTYIFSELFRNEAQQRRYVLDLQILDVMQKKVSKSEEKNFLFEKVLGFNREQSFNLANLIMRNYPRDTEQSPFRMPHLIILPDKMTPDFAELEIMVSRDPTFASNISRDYQRYDSQKRVFAPKPMYSEDEMAIIRGKEFELLKKLVKDPNMPI